MTTFLLNLWRLLAALWHGVKEDEEFLSLLFLLITLLGGATYFFWHVEGWSVIDSLYFSIMTMSTIGYGDFTPTTTFSKFFTILFSILSIGVFVAVVSKLVSIILEQKKIRKTKQKIFIIFQEQNITSRKGTGRGRIKTRQIHRVTKVIHSIRFMLQLTKMLD